MTCSFVLLFCFVFLLLSVGLISARNWAICVPHVFGLLPMEISMIQGFYSGRKKEKKKSPCEATGSAYEVFYMLDS